MNNPATKLRLLYVILSQITIIFLLLIYAGLGWAILEHSVVLGLIAFTPYNEKLSGIFFGGFSKSIDTNLKLRSSLRYKIFISLMGIFHLVAIFYSFAMVKGRILD
jgi:hypothetical protein